MKITTDTAKRIQLLRETKLIIEKSLAACTAELRMLEATNEPELFPVSSPYATFNYHRHARNHSEV